MFYENILNYIERNGLSVREFEKMCGLSNGLVSCWRNGSVPSTATVKKISLATHIPISRWLE